MARVTTKVWLCETSATAESGGMPREREAAEGAGGNTRNAAAEKQSRRRFARRNRGQKYETLPTSHKNAPKIVH